MPKSGSLSARALSCPLGDKKGCPPSAPATMAPRNRGQNPRGRRGQPSTHQQHQQQQEEQIQVPAITEHENQGTRDTAPTAPDPVTPVRRTGPFCVPQYNPHPLPARPESPDGEDFDFDEADAVPISAPPAAGALGSPVKCAHVIGGNQVNLQRKGDFEVWDESDEDIISV